MQSSWLRMQSCLHSMAAASPSRWTMSYSQVLDSILLCWFRNKGSKIEKRKRKFGFIEVHLVPFRLVWTSYLLINGMCRNLDLILALSNRKLLQCDLWCVTAAHRNEHLMGLLRTFSQELKGKEPASSERKRKKPSKKDERVIDVWIREECSIVVVHPGTLGHGS